MRMRINHSHILLSSLCLCEGVNNMVRKQKWSNQKIARNLMLPLVGILVLLVAGVGAFCLLNQPKPTLFSVGQALEMSVEQDQETAGPIFGYTAGFPWASGTVRLTVDSALLYSSVEAAGIDPAECTASVDSAVPFVLMQITLENVDAQLYDGMNFAVGRLISAQAFEGWNVLNGDYLTQAPVYFSDYPPISEESRDYFKGELPPGATKTFQLGFSIVEMPDELVFEVGTNGTAHKYGISLGGLTPVA